MEAYSTFFPRIKGKFNGVTDSYDPARHQLDAAAAPGNRVRTTLREKGTVVKNETILPAPSLLDIYDMASNTHNDRMTAGTIANLTGARLRYNPAAADEGLYFIDANGVASKVTGINKNMPSEIVFIVPSLMSMGNPYHVEVRTRFTPEGDLRVGRLQHDLTSVS